MRRQWQLPLCHAEALAASRCHQHQSIPSASSNWSRRNDNPTTIHLDINGREHALAVEPRVTLLDALREHLDLTGTKKGCDQGQCGACTVHVDGAARACLPDACRPGRGPRDHHHRRAGRAGRRRCTPCRPPSSSRTPSSAAIARRARSCRRSPASARAMPAPTTRSANTCRAISAAAAPIRTSSRRCARRRRRCHEELRLSPRQLARRGAPGGRAARRHAARRRHDACSTSPNAASPSPTSLSTSPISAGSTRSRVDARRRHRSARWPR